MLLSHLVVHKKDSLLSSCLPLSPAWVYMSEPSLHGALSNLHFTRRAMMYLHTRLVRKLGKQTIIPRQCWFGRVISQLAQSCCFIYLVLNLPGSSVDWRQLFTARERTAHAHTPTTHSTSNFCSISFSPPPPQSSFFPVSGRDRCYSLKGN